MTHTQQAPAQKEVVPICRKCRSPMVLRRLHTGKLNSYIGKFECGTCGRVVREAIKLEAISSPPLASFTPPSE